MFTTRMYCKRKVHLLGWTVVAARTENKQWKTADFKSPVFEQRHNAWYYYPSAHKYYHHRLRKSGERCKKNPLF